MSVFLSVRYCVETAQRIIKLFSTPSRHTILGFAIPNVMAIFRRGPSTHHSQQKTIVWILNEGLSMKVSINFNWLSRFERYYVTFALCHRNSVCRRWVWRSCTLLKGFRQFLQCLLAWAFGQFVLFWTAIQRGSGWWYKLNERVWKKLSCRRWCTCIVTKF